jgi:hypothetical protein
MEGMAPAVENLGAQPRKLGAAALDEKKNFSVYAIIKVHNVFGVIEKVWWTSAPLL